VAERHQLHRHRGRLSLPGEPGGCLFAQIRRLGDGGTFTSLVEQAFQMALRQRKPSLGLLLHSDRGSQYASDDYRKLLAKHQVTASMSRSGNCYDHAMKESFFAPLKTECASKPFVTRAEARTAVFEYIEGFYNRQRLHSALGHLSPEQFEQRSILPFR
jgi:putative transposase